MSASGLIAGKNPVNARPAFGAARSPCQELETDLEHPVLDATSLPAQPDDLVDQDYVDAQAAYSVALRDLVTS